MLTARVRAGRDALKSVRSWGGITASAMTGRVDLEHKSRWGSPKISFHHLSCHPA